MFNALFNYEIKSLKFSPKFAGVFQNYLQFQSENCYEA